MAKVNELMPAIHAVSPEKRFATEPSVGTLHPIRYATAAQRDLLSLTFAPHFETISAISTSERDATRMALCCSIQSC
jgi:hypothetical protein